MSSFLNLRCCKPNYYQWLTWSICRWSAAKMDPQSSQKYTPKPGEQFLWMGPSSTSTKLDMTRPNGDSIGYRWRTSLLSQDYLIVTTFGSILRQCIRVRCIHCPALQKLSSSIILTSPFDLWPSRVLVWGIWCHVFCWYVRWLKPLVDKVLLGQYGWYELARLSD